MPLTAYCPAFSRRLVKNIKDPQYGYWLYANYYISGPLYCFATERTVTRWWQAPWYIDYERSGGPAILIDVILKNKLPDEHERICIEYTKSAR